MLDLYAKRAQQLNEAARQAGIEPQLRPGTRLEELKEQEALRQQLGLPTATKFDPPVQEVPWWKKAMESLFRNSGGPINIQKGNEGKFTAKAKAAGMGTQAYANKVMSAPEGRYDPATRKQANFARNAAAWHKEDGGMIGPLAKTTHTTKDGDKYEMNYHNPLMVGQKSKEE